MHAGTTMRRVIITRVRFSTSVCVRKKCCSLFLCAALTLPGSAAVITGHSAVLGCNNISCIHPPATRKHAKPKVSTRSSERMRDMLYKHETEASLVDTVRFLSVNATERVVCHKSRKQGKQTQNRTRLQQSEQFSRKEFTPESRLESLTSHDKPSL